MKTDEIRRGVRFHYCAVPRSISGCDHGTPAERGGRNWPGGDARTLISETTARGDCPGLSSGPVSAHEPLKAENFFLLVREKGTRDSTHKKDWTPAAGLEERPCGRHGKELNSANSQDQLRTDSPPRPPAGAAASADALVLALRLWAEDRATPRRIPAPQSGKRVRS